MGKGKLAKFADMERYENVFQYPYSVVDQVPFEMKGRWHEDYFHNDNPIVLELGCGKGEYTVGLAQLYPDMNFIGVDRKFLADNGTVHLKTDSNFLFTYTTHVVSHNNLPLLFRTEDLYHTDGLDDETRRILSIRTYYENMWIERGLNIRYMKFGLPKTCSLEEPDVEIPVDEYRSYKRTKHTSRDTSK